MKGRPTVKRPLALCAFALALVSDASSAQPRVEARGVTGRVGLEAVISSGYLAELNGRYKLRVTEFRWEPGARVGEHHHAAPGIRYVASGEVTVFEGGTTAVYRAGDYYYEAGDVAHNAANLASSPALVLQFEVLPAEFKGGTLIPPRPR
jgi:quercetin dioxygenase-like cupin family protein